MLDDEQESVDIRFGIFFILLMISSFDNLWNVPAAYIKPPPLLTKSGMN